MSEVTSMPFALSPDAVEPAVRGWVGAVGVDDGHHHW